MHVLFSCSLGVGRGGGRRQGEGGEHWSRRGKEGGVAEYWEKIVDNQSPPVCENGRDHGDAPCWLGCGWVDHPYLDLRSYRDRVSVIKVMGKQRN